MEKAKFKLWCAQHPVFVNILRLCIVVFFACRIVIMTNPTKYVENMSDTSIAVFGTLLGAIVGGLFTLIGTHFDNKAHLKRQAEIKRNGLIYKPLYDELSKVKNDILPYNKYPRYFNYAGRKSHYPDSPQYEIWDRIKSDTRFLETPECIKTEMEELYKCIDNYLAVRENANNRIEDILNSTIQNELNISCDIRIGDFLLKKVFEEEKENIIDLVEEFFRPRTSIGEEEKARISNLFYETCLNDEHLNRLIESREKWIQQQDYVLEVLRVHICLVNLKYEG